ncbi:hypothetical protein CLM84_09350, partial [Streptomyces albidoflavus]
QTWATRLGALPEAAIVALAAVGFGWAATGAVRRRRAAATHACPARTPQVTGDPARRCSSLWARVGGAPVTPATSQLPDRPFSMRRVTVPGGTQGME